MLALAEHVDDVFAAVSVDLMGVAEGLGDLLAGVSAFEGEDFAQVRGRVKPSFLQAQVEGFGVEAELEEALLGLVGAGFMASREQGFGMVGVFKVAVASVVAAVLGDLGALVIDAKLPGVQVHVEGVVGVLRGDAVAVGLDAKAEGAGGA